MLDGRVLALAKQEPAKGKPPFEKAGFTHSFWDEFDFLHPSTEDYKAVEYRSAGAVGTGAGSGHFTVHEPWMLVDHTFVRLNTSPPTWGTVHLGESNPYTGGLIDHTKQVVNDLLGGR